MESFIYTSRIDDTHVASVGLLSAVHSHVDQELVPGVEGLPLPRTLLPQADELVASFGLALQVFGLYMVHESPSRRELFPAVRPPAHAVRVPSERL